MKLTLFTDYAMRTLLYLGARPERLCSIGEVAKAYRISQNHLMKVVVELVRSGHVESVRGRSGGIRLGMPPEEINVGAVVRHTEDGFDLVDCGSCIVAPACGLTGVLKEALGAFMAVLDRYTLADLLAKRGDIAAIFASQEISALDAAPIRKRRQELALQKEA
ncbi:Rrf2 family transcriptional regulator [Edaphosphingomonas haloaromaticamans]|uniref:HTH-type transcriptional repressor NsrR n=1 Tax=Edaphosphingomonas haloaromaticamans TaxID=653954 RepID=A0A1S1HB66_9SPHN|nr:Rrf2 family transcriptional regulator [Sphingomonas haloaromaticamans]OHT19377.1 HTH-type transcriptional repressor NsrR [Sphingomonas haloaromaticamans]